MEIPQIVDRGALEEFRSAARNWSLDPDNAWVGGYVDYEWRHGRHIYECLDAPVAGARILEFGCNVGATSIVLARMGGQVTGVDVERKYVELARLNAASYGFARNIDFQHTPFSTSLPFGDGHFDLIVCNSVLEYVRCCDLAPSLRELDRLLKVGGLILIQGTSNRLWPREMHSRRWLVNYMPRIVDRYLQKDLQRGVFPWEVRKGLGSRYVDLDLLDRGGAYLEARKRMGASDLWIGLLRVSMQALHPLQVTVGWLTPSISMQLRKEVVQ